MTRVRSPTTLNKSMPPILVAFKKKSESFFECKQRNITALWSISEWARRTRTTQGLSIVLFVRQTHLVELPLEA